jgi:hypothetical protein
LYVSTSCGGANAYAKSDWKLLADRRLLVWPDDDEAGAKYARAVSTILADLECEISIIGVAELVTHFSTPNADGFDAVDGLADNTDVAELRKLAAGLAA